MPTWSELLSELRDNPGPQGEADYDRIRKKYISELTSRTERNCIVFYSDFLSGLAPRDVQITLGDMAGLMEACRGLSGPIDLILHSPGGDPAAAASIVRYLWKKYDDIRVFVPLAAMSAATLICFSANSIVMGKHSQLGPIDPQLGGIAAGAILADFRMAQDEAAEDSRNLRAWEPLLSRLAPGMITQLEQAITLSKRLATEWLSERMLKDEPFSLAEDIAEYFADFHNHNLHSVGVDREVARSIGLKVEDLEADQALQDAVLSVHHACMHTFSGYSGVLAKIIENNLGRAWVHVAPR